MLGSVMVLGHVTHKVPGVHCFMGSSRPHPLVNYGAFVVLNVALGIIALTFDGMAARSEFTPL